MARDKARPREAALKHLYAALETGVRGANRDAICQAIAVLEDTKRGDLSDLHYRQLREGAKLVDPDRPGLIMRHGKRSGRVWTYRFDDPTTHKQVEIQLGRYPDVSTSEARELWQELRRQRLNGHRPSLHDDSDDASALTVDQLVHRYLVEYARKVKRPSSTITDERLLVNHLVRDYGSMRATELTRDHVAAILLGIKERGAPREAEKMRAVMMTMFNVARGKTRKISMLSGTWLPPDTLNPVETVVLERRAARHHNPTVSELRAYVRGLNQFGVYGDVLRTQLETCTRISEVTGLEWSELDLDDAVWTLPAARSKNNRAHKVMLAEPTAERLRLLAGRSVSRFVFPAMTDKSKPIRSDGVAQKLAKNREKIGISERFTSHSIRHACLTWLAENGCPREVRDRISNHAPVSIGGVDHIYNAAELNRPAREWLRRWVEYTGALEGENVVLMKSSTSPEAP